MKIFNFILILIFTMGTYSVAVSQDFQKSNFGDNMQKVKLIEGKPLSEFIRENDSSICIVYADKFGGVNSDVLFTFMDNKFIRGAYDLTNSKSLNNNSFTQFIVIENLLITKYGKPTISIDYRSNDNFNKEVQLASEWQINRIKISHTLFTSNFHIVDYDYK